MDEAISMLLLCADAQTVSTVDAACKAYKIQAEICLSASEALNVIQQRRFALVVVDLDVPQSTDLLKYLGINGGGHPMVTIAISSRVVDRSPAAARQIHLTLKKPFTPSLMERSLQAAYKLLLNQTRAAFRYLVEMAASAAVVQHGPRRVLENVVLQDLSSTGLRLRTDSPVAKGCTIFVDFQLPDTTDQIHSMGRIIWASPRGEVGVQFLSISAAEFAKLRDWLSTKCPWTAELPLRACGSTRLGAWIQ